MVALSVICGRLTCILLCCLRCVRVLAACACDVFVCCGGCCRRRVRHRRLSSAALLAAADDEDDDGGRAPPKVVAPVPSPPHMARTASPFGADGGLHGDQATGPEPSRAQAAVLPPPVLPSASAAVATASATSGVTDDITIDITPPDTPLEMELDATSRV